MGNNFNTVEFCHIATSNQPIIGTSFAGYNDLKFLIILIIFEIFSALLVLVNRMVLNIKFPDLAQGSQLKGRGSGWGEGGEEKRSLKLITRRL